MRSLISCLLILFIHCQSADLPEVVDSPEAYLAQVEANEEMQLVDLQGLIPDITLDIRYASADNFTGSRIYPEAAAFLRKPVAEAINAINDSLAQKGLSVKIYDAYRPYSATVKFYEIYPDKRYVADPAEGSRHNRGCAVDLSLVDLKTGVELEMPTEFDDFTERAHIDYPHLSDTVKANRKTLVGIMKHFGFEPLPTEWWHFDYVGWENYPLMDLSFEQLRESNKAVGSAAIRR